MRLAQDPSTGAEASRKGDIYDFVTPADGAIERYLRARVVERFPDHTFVGEEEGGALGAGWVWVVDPIDGTLNYSTGLPGAVCSIACLRDGQPVVGVIGDFTSGVVYGAMEGTGTILADDEEGETVIRPSTSPAGLARIFVDFGWEDLDPVTVGTIELLALAGPRTMRMVGGAAYALLHVALRGGCFLGIGLRLWDIAAGIVLAGEAGRRVRTWDEGSRVHVLVGSAADLMELAPIVEEFGSKRVAPAV